MSVISELATSLNRRDEVPNKEVAASIIRRRNSSDVVDLIENLSNKNKGIRHDCIKVLYEIGYSAPELISPHLDTFLKLLSSKDNRMQWGAMAALACIVKKRPDDVHAALPVIIEAADKGSVITRDNAVRILIWLFNNEKYANEAFAYFIRQVSTCPTNQLAMYAEEAAGSVPLLKRNEFVRVLTSRLEELGKESQRKRIEKVIRACKKLQLIPPGGSRLRRN